MNKVYISLLTFLLVSCGTSLRYVGETLPPTDKVDVYIARESIKKPFDFIGKAYIVKLVGIYNPENIQRKSIKLAKEKGADGILITDQHFFNTGTLGVTGTDSIGKVGVSTVHSEISSQMNIYFIKYTR